jgi:hypothetical protein
MTKIDTSLVEKQLDEGEEVPSTANDHEDPDEFFAKNAFRVVYQTNNFLVPQLKELIQKGEIINLRPEYQRRLRWSTPNKSRLIESLLLNIPVPTLFLYEREEARYEVMDGQQRLNAVKEYLEGGFALSGLQILTPLNGLRYSKLPPRVKRAMDRASLSAIILLVESQTERQSAKDGSVLELRRFVFDRLNSGGTKLNAQELRNAIYPGHFNRTIVECARDRVFTDTFKIPPYTEPSPSEYYENPRRQKNKLYATMGDCQLVLRYFALVDPQNIRGSMKSMLDRAMEDRMQMSQEEASAARDEYIQTIHLAREIFGTDAFVLPPDQKGTRRLSAALYDATMVAVRHKWKRRSFMIANSACIRSALRRLLLDTNSLELLVGKKNTAQAVKDRITLLSSICEAQ